MDSRISRAVRLITASLVVIFAVSGLFAQDDADPNSPTPVLYTFADSARALAQPRRSFGRIEPSEIKPQAFQPGSRIVVYAGGLQPMEGEGANAYRVFAVDASGHQFRYPVLDVARRPNSRNVFAVTLQLTDEIRYWNAPEPDGDITVYLTWRGLSSNRVRLGLGEMGGKIKDEGLVRSAPLGSIAERPARTVEQNISGYRWAGDRLRFLEQATFGPTSALDNRIRRIGLRSWISEQFEAQYPSVGNAYPIFPLQPGTPPVLCDGGADDVPANCGRDSYSMYQPQTWFFREAFYGEAPLKHRVTWALSQMWVTSGVDVQQGRHMIEYQKVISNNAFGNYRNLMKQMTLNPTMGGYLDMAGSTRTNPNENYAREIMQLFSIGLFMLNPDGTVQVDTNGDPIPTYTQDGVNNLTKVLTGWSFCPQNQPTLCPNQAVGTVNYIDPMVINAAANQSNIANNRHDLTAKTLLSYPGATTTSLPACGNCTTFANVATYAGNSLDQAIDNIFYHPNVGPFVGRFMIQHLVTSDPTPAYISRVAAAFNDNGAGVRGDMRSVVRAVLLDPEARGDVKTDPNFGKLREPVLYATNILRAFNVRGVSTPQSDGYMYARGEFSGMAQVPFLAPTVFNFFPPDYGIPGTTLLGPEFAIMTTGTAIQRTNFVWRFIFISPPVPVAPPNAPSGTIVDLSDLQALSAADSTGDLLIEELNRRMLHGTMSEGMKTTLRPAITAYASTDTLNRARQAVYLIAASSQYQVQR
ncbi:MAG: DUF1800 family protein [Pyrinomonadaceae bacterium]